MAQTSQSQYNKRVIGLVFLGLVCETGFARSILAQPKSIVAAPSGFTSSHPLPDAAEFRRNPGNNTVQRLKAPNLASGLLGNERFRSLIDAKRWEDASLFFLSTISEQLRLKDPSGELRLDSFAEDGLGFKHLRFGQIYRNLPAWGCELQVHWRSDGSLYLIDGHYIPTPEHINIRPLISSELALEKARDALSLSALKSAAEPPVELGLHRQQGRVSPLLAYRVILPSGLAHSWQIIIDAHSGRLLEKTQGRR